LRILDCKFNKKNLRRIKIKFEKERIREEEVGSLSHWGHAKRDFILERKKEKNSPSLFL